MELKQAYKIKEKVSPTSSSISIMDNAQQRIASRAPWEFIAPFLELSDVLKLRAVSKEVLASLHEGTSREQCATWLSKTLQEDNLYMMNNIGKWHDATNELSNQMGACLKYDPMDPLDSLVLCMRVIKHMPEEMAVCYSDKYGRHCLPWSGQREAPNASSVRLGQYEYPPCGRGTQNCETCISRIPSKERKDEKIQGSYCLDDFFQIQDNHQGGFIDLHRHYNRCIPNLPPDLICPVCRVSDRRTLMLTDMSYQSEAGTEKPEAVHMPLTFTPQNAAVKESATKRAKTDEDDGIVEESFPPKYREMFIPEGSFPLEYTPDCKHCIAIHCSSCRKFGVIAPAGLCSQRRFNCPERGAQVNFSCKSVIKVGGVLRRTKCSKPGCNNPALCSTCSYHSSSTPYGLIHEFDRCLMCDKCEKVYCWEHDGSGCCQ